MKCVCLNKAIVCVLVVRVCVISMCVCASCAFLVFSLWLSSHPRSSPGRRTLGSCRIVRSRGLARGGRWGLLERTRRRWRRRSRRTGRTLRGGLGRKRAGGRAWRGPEGWPWIGWRMKLSEQGDWLTSRGSRWGTPRWHSWRFPWGTDAPDSFW